jgi:single-strand DNA-binding protein
MNTISLIGNLTKAPETREVGTDNSVTTLRIAVNKMKKDAPPMYVDVKVWNAQGKNCERFLDKGSKVGVVGRLEIDEVEGRDGSGKKYFTSVVANQVDFLSPKDGDADAVPAGRPAADLDEMEF